MKKYLFTSLILSLNLALFTQNDYISYYHLCRKADNFYKEKNIDSASVAFQQAFSKVDYIHNNYLITAAKVEKMKGNSEKASEYLILIDKHKNSINNELKRQIDSLGKEDQRVRTNKYLKARDYYYANLYDSTFIHNQKKLSEFSIVMADWWKTDSLNIIALNNIICKYGFPGERLVGADAYNSAMIIILHFDKDTSNFIMSDKLNHALENGDLMPKDYAWIIDRHLSATGKKQIYYSIAIDMENLTQEEKKEYDKNRFSIGLGKLQDIVIKKKGNRILIKY